MVVLGFNDVHERTDRAESLDHLAVGRTRSIFIFKCFANASTGEFPKRIPLGRGRHAWSEEEINNWIASRIAARDAEAANIAA